MVAPKRLRVHGFSVSLAFQLEGFWGLRDLGFEGLGLEVSRLTGMRNLWFSELHGFGLQTSKPLNPLNP